MARPAVRGLATHLCAAASLFYVTRVASFAASWAELPLLPARPPNRLPRVSILVPARDEERSIERCVRSLLAQRWIDFEVIVVDDRSVDATPAILERLAREDSRLRVVRGAELPDGWVGKPWALDQGAKLAKGEWLLFTDADSCHAPEGVATALYYATRMPVDALSIATHQELGTFWERAILPSVLGLILFASGSLGEINDPRSGSALANGQYLLVSRDAYDALGGHDALRGEIVEDLEFARRLKADGRFRLLLASGESLASVRMYRSLGEIRRGFTKNAFAGAKGNPASLFGGVAFLLTVSALPPAFAVRALAARRYGEAAEALACTAAIVAAAAWGFGRVRLPRRLAVFAPLGIAAFAAIALESAVLVLSGRGVEWRGRTYLGRSPGKGVPQAEPRPGTGLHGAGATSPVP
jgi:chlorobactene glucosyltransferase